MYFVEEPVFDDTREPWIQLEMQDGVVVVLPHLPSGLSERDVAAAQRQMLDRLITTEEIRRFVLWYYTPLALRFTDHLEPMRVAYDCMDELSLFKGASSDLPELEQQLLRRADVVFTGGQSLFEAKKANHPNIHAMPSSVDVAHFAAARHAVREPADQLNIPSPRLGFFGVIDERLDIALLEGMADARPHWQLVMVGPVVKIDPAELPRRPNIHYLGAKTYAELPLYLGGWSVALLPFARNEATRFISPTKTPEYLAAGRPVVSTSIRDVMSPYGELGLVAIADTVDEMVRACEAALIQPDDSCWARADAFLRGMSWDTTWRRMASLLDGDAAVPGGAAQPSAASAGA
ncbi:MAG TPA: glycosyltransferase [Jiangellaceae bacterium]